MVVKKVEKEKKTKKRKNPNLDKYAIGMLIAYYLPFALWGFVTFNQMRLGSFVQIFQVEIPGKEATWGFGNITRLFTEGFADSGVMWEGLKNSLLFFSLTIIGVPCNLFVAYFFYKKITGHKVFRIIYYLPNVIPGIVFSMLVKYITAPDGAGVLASLFYKMGKDFPNIFGDSRYAIWGLLVYSFWVGFGSGFLLYLSSMKRVPQEVIESAALDGITWLKEIVYIVFPLIFPVVMMIIIQLIPTIFTSSGAVLFFTQGDYGTYTISYWIFDKVRSRSDLNYSTTVSLFFSLLTLPFSLLSYWLMNKVPAAEY